MKEERKNAAKKKWISKRHSVARNIASVIMGPILRLKYRISVQPFREKKDRNYLILFNHQTPSDQFFVGMSFKKPVYYVASEDIFSNGWISSVIRFLAAPIPIKKNTGDARAVLTCMRVASEGGTIAMAPEGNRTYSGRTCNINGSVVPFIRRLKLPVLIYRIEGGYGAEPRWSSKVRKGKMRSYVARVIEPEEYAEMSNAQLLGAIQEGLYIDENLSGGIFKYGRRAEYIERAAYVCPNCGLSVFKSKKNTVKCTKCGISAEYGTDKQLSGAGCDFPFKNFGEWYDYQNRFVSSLDPAEYIDEPAYRDNADLYSVVLYKKKNRIGKGSEILLYGDRVEISGGGTEPLSLPFDSLSSVTVLGRNKLNLYHGKNTYQLKGGKRFNALKYVNFYYHAMNRISGAGGPNGAGQNGSRDGNNLNAGDENGEFLGL